MQKLRSWRINAERALDRTRTCDPGIRNPLLYQAELRERMADSPLRMVGTIGNGKIMTKPKNTRRSGLEMFGPENVMNDTRAKPNNRNFSIVEQVGASN